MLPGTMTRANREAWKPSREEIAAAYGRTVPDLMRKGLRVLFVGINPSLYSGAVGHHFARPGNRFWKALHGAGFTERVLSPFEERELLASGMGITNLVERSTASAAELAPAELEEGGRRLLAKLRRSRPGIVAVVGVAAYRQAFGEPAAAIGSQREPVGASAAWVLPNPSGLNAHYQLPDLVAAFDALRAEVDRRLSRG